MNWTNVSPGIDTTEHSGYTVTRIADKPIWTGRVDCKGRNIMLPVYNYIAVKKALPVDIKHTATTWDVLVKKIGSSVQMQMLL